VVQAGAVALGDPPTFGPGGEWPPLEGRPVVIASVMFLVGMPPGQSLAEYKATVTGWTRVGWAFAEYVSGMKWETLYRQRAAGQERRRRKPDELREAVYSQAWQRADPIVQLPPGASHELAYTTTCGVSATQTTELAQSLGLKVGQAAQLAGQLSSKFAIQAALTEQRTVTETVTLRNDGPRAYRLYARWSIRHDVTVSRILTPPGHRRQGSLKEDIERRAHVQLYRLSFTASPTAVLTYCEIEK
jgi:hypothetical protein